MKLRYFFLFFFLGFLSSCSISFEEDGTYSQEHELYDPGIIGTYEGKELGDITAMAIVVDSIRGEIYITHIEIDYKYYETDLTVVYNSFNFESPKGLCDLDPTFERTGILYNCNPELINDKKLFMEGNFNYDIPEEGFSFTGNVHYDNGQGISIREGITLKKK